jgi:hypothetical protein
MSKPGPWDEDAMWTPQQDEMPKRQNKGESKMGESWYARWEGVYVGSADERKNFDKWYDEQNDEGRIDPDTSETDLMNDYRDTQEWTDRFLDWAWVMQSDEVHEAASEQHSDPEPGGYVFWHSRSTDTVLFGPFPNKTSAWTWYQAHGRRLGVQACLSTVRAPADNHHALWGEMKGQE